MQQVKPWIKPPRYWACLIRVAHLIDRYAAEGNEQRFKFPEPQIPGLNFSFSGLKTAILYFIRDEKVKDPDFIEKNLADICASIQARIVSILLNKLKKAAIQTGIKIYVLLVV